MNICKVHPKIQGYLIIYIIIKIIKIKITCHIKKYRKEKNGIFQGTKHNS